MRRPVALALFLALSGALSAQEELQTSFAAGVASQSVFRGVKHAGSVAEADAGLAGGGWNGSLRYREPRAAGESGEGNLEGGYAWSASDQVKLAADLRQNWVSDPRPGATRQSTETGLTISWTPQQNLTFATAWFHDFRLRADTWELSAAYSQALPSLGAYLEWKAYAGAARAQNLSPDAGAPDVRDSYAYYGADLQLPYHLPVGHATLTAGLHVAGTSGQNRAWSPIDAAGGFRAWADLSVGFDF